jgi:hypothetical protein
MLAGESDGLTAVDHAINMVELCAYVLQDSDNDREERYVGISTAHHRRK